LKTYRIRLAEYRKTAAVNPVAKSFRNMGIFSDAIISYSNETFIRACPFDH
jgi:hypothetical protein